MFPPGKNPYYNHAVLAKKVGHHGAKLKHPETTCLPEGYDCQKPGTIDGYKSLGRFFFNGDCQMRRGSNGGEAKNL